MVGAVVMEICAAQVAPDPPPPESVQPEPRACPCHQYHIDKAAVDDIRIVFAYPVLVFDPGRGNPTNQPDPLSIWARASLPGCV